MANVIISILLIVIVGAACLYIWKEKKKGIRCIGCPMAGSASCHCGQTSGHGKHKKNVETQNDRVTKKGIT